MSDRFGYKKGEVEFGNSQCDFCEYNNPENIYQCVKYPQKKPEDIVKTLRQCKYLKIKVGL